MKCRRGLCVVVVVLVVVFVIWAVAYLGLARRHVVSVVPRLFAAAAAVKLAFVPTSPLPLL